MKTDAVGWLASELQPSQRKAAIGLGIQAFGCSASIRR